MKIFTITLILSLILIVGGFFCPPIGIIDGSVLTAIGELIMLIAIGKLPEIIKASKSVKIQKGDFSAEIETERAKHEKSEM